MTPGEKREFLETTELEDIYVESLAVTIWSYAARNTEQAERLLRRIAGRLAELENRARFEAEEPAP